MRMPDQKVLVVQSVVYQSFSGLSNKQIVEMWTRQSFYHLQLVRYLDGRFMSK